jgi:hypothetical protein
MIENKLRLIYPASIKECIEKKVPPSKVALSLQASIDF